MKHLIFENHFVSQIVRPLRTEPVHATRNSIQLDREFSILDPIRYKNKKHVFFFRSFFRSLFHLFFLSFLPSFLSFSFFQAEACLHEHPVSPLSSNINMYILLTPLCLFLVAPGIRIKNILSLVINSFIPMA